MHPQPPPPKKSLWIVFLLPIAAFPLLGLAISAWGNWHPPFLEPSWTTAFRHTAAGWQKLPPLPDRLKTLRVSSRGTVWAEAFTHKSGDVFARLDGDSWRIYRGKELADKSLYTSSAFVLDGEEIWATTSHGVLHWDGQYWQLNRDLKAAILVAAAGRVMAIDDKRRLSQFESGRWKTLSIEPPNQKADDESWDEPTLALTADGTLWLGLDRLWRLDGSRWEEVETDFEHPDLLGATGDRIWISDARNLRSLSTDGKTQAVYTPAQIGLSSREWVYQAVSQDGRTYFAASQGIVEFDGQSWRRLPLPPDGVNSISSLHAGPGADLWAIGHIPNPAWKYARFAHVLVPLAFGLGFFAIPVYMVRRFKRERLYENQRARQAVEHATGEAPEQLQRAERRLQKESTWWGASATVALPVAAGIGFSILRIFWRAAPSWIFLLLAVAMHAVYVLRRSLVKRTPKPWEPIEPGGPRYDWGDVGKALPATLVVFFLMNFDVLRRFVGDPTIWILVGFWVWFASRFVTAFFVNVSLRRADYDGALKVVRRFRFHSPDGAKSLSLRGLILFHAGRYREAEDTLRRAVAASGGGAEQAHALEYLAAVLMEQGRYDDAMRGYEAALHAQAGNRGPYRGMAELLLRRHQDPQRALEYVENVGSSSRRTRDDYWALKAWALAELGRTAEVGEAIEKAVRATNPKSRPDLAATYYRAAMAMQAIGNTRLANDYLARARDTDPQGRRGAGTLRAEAGLIPALGGSPFRTPPGT